MKDDERLLLSTLQALNQPYVRDVVRKLDINEKRAAYICQKWADKGWYDYGVNVLAGWLTDDAPQRTIG